jgi:NAD(P)-dependent dehydrogenase (short-subunit alcohol dehydrogenase family)
MLVSDIAALPRGAGELLRRRFAPEDLTGRVAAVTGAGHGIGRGVALALAAAGCRLALSDIDQERLRQTVALLPPEATVRTWLVDVADRSAVSGWAEEVAAEFGGVDIVVNNAGIAHLGTVAGTSYEDLQRILDTNLMGTVHGTKAFLPLLAQSDSAHLVNVASIFGVVAVPTQSAYAISKFAVRGFSEALAAEMRLLGTGVQVHVVLPGGVATAIARDASAGDAEGLIDVERTRAGFHLVARTTPEEAGRIIVRGVRRGRRRILIGTDALLLDVAARLLPTGYQSIVVRVLR